MSKRFTLFAFLFMLPLVAMAQTPNTDWFNIEYEEFTISSADELAGLAQIVNATWGGTPAKSNFSGKTIILSNDINLSAYGVANAEFNSGKGWVPIGPSASSPFRGTFDGGGHKISGLSIYDTTNLNFAGLFGYVSDGGTIRNIGLENVDITNIRPNNSSAGGYTGGIVGSLNAPSTTGNNALVENCYVTGSIKGSGGSAVGGIAGDIYGTGSTSTIKNCYSMGTVSGNSHVGGIAGNVSGTRAYVNTCYSTAEVIGTPYYSYSNARYIGGIAGEGGYVNNSVALNMRVVNGNSSTDIWRIIGRSSNSSSLSNNAAFVNLLNSSNTTDWGNVNHKDGVNGEDLSLSDIMAGETLGDRFTMGEDSPWTTGQFSLPGLFGETVPLPVHLTPSPYIVQVTVTPSEFPWVDLGETKTFLAGVVGINNPVTTVNWSIVGNKDAGTTISSSGLLTISNSETNSRFIVRATSTLDPSKYASVTVNVRIPYTIGTAAELAAFADTINAGNNFTGRLAILTNNIDLSIYGEENTEFNDGRGWIPIGKNATPFFGEFNGKGYVIRNLYISNNINDAGLFGVIGRSSSSGSDTGLVKNIGLENVNINARGPGFSNAGGVAGRILGYGGDNGDFTSAIINTYVTGKVTGVNNVGGIAGFVDGWGLVQNSYTTAEITASGSRVGGIAGDIKGAIQNCAALNTRVSGSSANRITDRSNTYSSLSNNVGFIDMLNSAGNNTWSPKGLTTIHGADINAIAINEPGTIGGRFAEKDGWTTMAGRLPGFRGATLAMPEHLIVYSDAVEPQITQQPLGAAIATDMPYTMSIEANAPDGGILSYQWYMNTSPSNIGGTAIPGATSASYAITISITGTYYYYVTVKNTMPGYNRTASVTSTLVALVVGGGDGQDPIVVNVTVLPSQIPVADVGRTYTFTANVIGINNPVTTVNWSIVGEVNEGTSVSLAGILTVSENETNKSFFVRAVSTANSNARDSALVNVRVPYKIGTAEQLKYFADSINSGKDFSGRLVILTADIDLSVYGASTTEFNGGKGWIPIGSNYSRPFRGEFDGRGHVVRRLYINDASLDYAGFFGQVGTTSTVTGVGAIRNIGLEDVNITAKNYVGGIVGAIRGYGTYVGTNNQRDFNSNITNCYVTGTINSSLYAGGIAGIVGSWGGINHCYTTAEVTGMGGIAGDLNEGEIANCVALNPSVKMGTYNTGRIAGRTSLYHFSLSNNAAFANMLNSHDANFWIDKELNKINGQDITASAIKADGTLGGRFTVANGWTIQNGKLPGFLGKTVAMPNYIEEDETPIYEVTFNSNGGSNVNAQFVPEGNLIVQPADPTKEGFTFLGWFSELLNRLWNFATDLVMGDTTLNAQWDEISSNSEQPSSSSSEETSSSSSSEETSSNSSSSNETQTSSSSDSGTPEPSSSSSQRWPFRSSSSEETNPVIISRIASGQTIIQATSNAILLENLPNNAKVQIYNLQGRRIYSNNNHENPKILRIMVQTKGLYIIKINSAVSRVVVR